jgi:hypothetical protein
MVGYALGTNSSGSGQISVLVLPSLTERAISSEIQISAGSLTPTKTNGATPAAPYEMPTNKQNVVGMAFLPGVTGQADFTIPTMPSDYNGGAILVKFNWTTIDDTTANSVTWYVKALALGDGDSYDQAWGSAASISDANGSAAYQKRTSGTCTLTIGGAPAAGKSVVLRVYRASGDTLGHNAILTGVTLIYTRN